MVTHNEFKNTYSGPKTQDKQLTIKDLINKRHEPNSLMCIGFDVEVVLEIQNKPFIQVFHYDRNLENPNIWQITSQLGDGGTLGDVPIRIQYETPIKDFELVKVAAMGLLYVKLTLQERTNFYEMLNYELVEATEGI